MDITAYKNSDGVSLIEMGFLSSPIAWMNEFIAPDKTESEMMEWCSNFYSTQKLTEEELNSIRQMALRHPKMIPRDFLFTLTIACEIVAKVLKVSENNSTD